LSLVPIILYFRSLKTDKTQGAYSTSQVVHIFIYCEVFISFSLFSHNRDNRLLNLHSPPQTQPSSASSKAAGEGSVFHFISECCVNGREGELGMIGALVTVLLGGGVGKKVKLA
jgi:hypothetical protein